MVFSPSSSSLVHLALTPTTTPTTTVILANIDRPGFTQEIYRGSKHCSGIQTTATTRVKTTVTTAAHAVENGNAPGGHHLWTRTTITMNR